MNIKEKDYIELSNFTRLKDCRDILHNVLSSWFDDEERKLYLAVTVNLTSLIDNLHKKIKTC